MKNNSDRLMDAALHLFSLRGYNAVGVQEIVDSVSLSKPTLYHYFGSKYGLLESLLRRGTSAHLQSLQIAAGYEHDLTLTLKKIAQITFQFADENRIFFRFWSSLNFAPAESDEARCNQPLNDLVYNTIYLVFEAAEHDHGNMVGRAGLYTANYMGMLSEISRLIVEDRLVVDDAVMYQVLHQFEHGIYS